MSRYEKTIFLVPAPHDPLQLRAPGKPKKPLPGASKFVRTEQAYRNFDWGRFANIGPSDADQEIAERLARAASIDPFPRNPDGVRQDRHARSARAPRSEGAGAGYYPQQPWAEMPPNGVPFDHLTAIATPANNDVETTVLSFRVPFGLDGVIKRIQNRYEGGGFVQGSGSLIWRIRVAGQAVRNYDNINTTMGSLEEGRSVEGGLLVYSDQTVQYTVTHASSSTLAVAGTFIICGLKGYYWPRR